MTRPKPVFDNEIMGILAQLASIENLGTWASLEKLAEAYAESRTSSQTPAPYSTLFLKSGLSMRGQVLALSNDAGPNSVLFLIHDSKAQEPTDLTYVLWDEIAAVTIHSAAGIIERLSDGRVAKPSGPPPTRGELALLLKTMIDEINVICEGAMTADLGGVPEGASAEALNAISLTMRDLHATLRKLATEELARQALRELGLRFSFHVGDLASVQVTKSQFEIYIGVQGSKTDRVSRESLRVNIEELF